MTILSEKTDKSSSTHTKVIRASINVRAIELEMSKRTASSNVDKQNKSEMAWVFVARRANEVTEFDIRRTDVTDVSKQNKRQFLKFMMQIQWARKLLIQVQQ